MKKFITLFLILSLLPIISAVEFDMKTEFSMGETLIAKVSGNFLEPVLKEDIFFYRGHVKIPMQFDVAKIHDNFYIYAQLLDKYPANYSIVIKNAMYMEAGKINEQDIVKNFSIINSTADFSINPGFIITQQDFFIKVQNLQDSKITIKIKTISNKTGEGFFASLFGDEIEQSSITLKSGEIKKVNFKINNTTKSLFRIIELSTENLKYEIPVYIYADKTKSEKKQRGFKIQPSELNISIPTNSNTTRILYLHNTGKERLENISLSVSDSLRQYVFFSAERIDELDENSSIKIKVQFFSDDKEKILKGQIKAKTNGLYTSSAVSLNFIKDYVPLDEGTRLTKTCAEMNGTICNQDEECDRELVYAKDDKCCLGTCKKIKKSPVQKIIGCIIIIAVAISLIWFFKTKYKRVKKRIDLLKIGKGK